MNRKGKGITLSFQIRKLGPRKVILFVYNQLGGDIWDTHALWILKVILTVLCHNNSEVQLSTK